MKKFLNLKAIIGIGMVGLLGNINAIFGPSAAKITITNKYKVNDKSVNRADKILHVSVTSKLANVSETRTLSSEEKETITISADKIKNLQSKGNKTASAEIKLISASTNKEIGQPFTITISSGYSGNFTIDENGKIIK